MRNLLASDKSLQWCNQKVNFYSGPKGGFLARAQEKRQRLQFDHHPNSLHHPNCLHHLNLNGFLIYEILRHTKTRKPHIPKLFGAIANFKCVFANFGRKTLIQSSFTLLLGDFCALKLIVTFLHFWRYLVILKLVHQVKYRVTVYTASMKFAGTDEKISVAIAGNRCCLFAFLQLVFGSQCLYCLLENCHNRQERFHWHGVPHS